MGVRGFRVFWETLMARQPNVPPGMAKIKMHGRTYITDAARAHFISQEVGGYAHAFGMGDLRALIVWQVPGWMASACARGTSKRRNRRPRSSPSWRNLSRS